MQSPTRHIQPPHDPAATGVLTQKTLAANRYKGSEPVPPSLIGCWYHDVIILCVIDLGASEEDGNEAAR